MFSYKPAKHAMTAAIIDRESAPMFDAWGAVRFTVRTIMHTLGAEDVRGPSAAKDDAWHYALCVASDNEPPAVKLPHLTTLAAVAATFREVCIACDAEGVPSEALSVGCTPVDVIGEAAEA